MSPHPGGTLSIAGRAVGPGCPCYVIAEAGVNHNGDLSLARRLVDCAADAGADAVKFQTFSADALVTADAPKADYQARATGASESQRDLLRRLELSADAHRQLMDQARQRGIQFLSTPFDEASADFLDALGVAAFKLPSGELTNLSLLAHVARTRKPMIVSTGMATLGEVEAALRAISQAGNAALVLLHCVSAYPAPAEDANLRAMRTMELAFRVPVGYSDHTLGLDVPLAAVALGACVVEKHVTLDRQLPGPDHAASAEPAELASLVRGIRNVEAALGDGRKVPAPSELNTAAVARRSLVAARDIPAGAILTDDLLTLKRPGTGLPPAMRTHVVGRRTRQPIPAGAVLSLGDLA